MLRTNLQFGRLENPVRTLLVTSSGLEEDRSTTVGNLAVAIAQGGTTALAVDCDLRRPSLHKLFDLGNDKGLSTALLGDKGAELPLQATSVPNLRVLTAGPTPANPADLLGSKRMREVLEIAVASAEMVLLDSPPIAFVADAAMLASTVDGVILAVSAGKTRREAARRTQAVLERANARVLGVVLCNARLDSGLSRYHDLHRK